mgnify:CR=1 FL=1
MSSPELSQNFDPESAYEDLQGEVVSDVPGRIRRAASRILRTKGDLMNELEENPAIAGLIDSLHCHDFYVSVHGVADNIVFTVQRHKKPIIGITAAAIAAGALYHEFTKNHDDGTDQSE